MPDIHDTISVTSTTTVSDARETYQDLDELHDERFVSLHIRELFGLGSQEHDEGFDMLDDV